MTWRDGGHYGRLCRAITDESGSRAICYVWTKQNAEHRGGGIDGSGTEPYPQGEENFALILKAPVLLEALERMVKVYEAHFMPLPDGQQPEGAYTQARAAIAAVKGE